MTERFIDAAKDGFLDILREGSKRDLNTPDEDGMTATLWAARNGHLEALRLIVGREGDVDRADYLGMTAIHHAATRGHMSVVSYLVHWGCNVYALDNDHHSALDVAAMYDRHEIVRYLDACLAEKKAKNPKQVMRMKEEAEKAMESNIKRYEKLTDNAAKKAGKEHRRIQMELEQHLKQQNGVNNVDSKTKQGFFKTLTLRIKGVPNEKRKLSVFPDESAISSSGTRNGTANKFDMKRLASVPSNSTGISEFSVRDLDDSRNQTIKSTNKGFTGSTSEVVYVAGTKGMQKGELSLRKGELYHTNIYRAKSESELLDSGIDSNYGEEDDDKSNGGMFNRPEFGKLAFLPKNPFLSTLQSFDDDAIITSTSNDTNSGGRHLSAKNEELLSSEDRNDITQKQSPPWDQDDLSNLDDDEDEREANELSTVNMFLWSCGLASYLHIFSQEKIDMQVLSEMTDSELKELGLPFGPRKKIRDAITRRKMVLNTPTKMTDTHL